MPAQSHPLVQAELPPSVVLDAGGGGLPRLRVSHPSAEAEVYLHGAHVTSWTPAGQQPVLWLSRQSRFQPGEAIRGGVPICFPWFAAHPEVAQAPSHGFARIQDWILVAADESRDEVTLSLRLTDSEDSRSTPWPHPFEAVYRVTVGPTLTLALEVTNTGEVTVSYEEALHTYFAVRDVGSIAITGLEDTAYLDKVAGPNPKRQPDEPVRFEGETDRIYLNTRATTTILDATHDRAMSIGKEGSEATVVWNPWAEKAQVLIDFGDDEWRGMCCVETCNVGESRVHLVPGDRHVMAATIHVASPGRGSGVTP